MDVSKQLAAVVVISLLVGGAAGYLIGNAERSKDANLYIQNHPGSKEREMNSLRQFAHGLAQKTGLAFPVALAWTKVEGGRQNNFLNIDALRATKKLSPRRAGILSGRWIQGKYNEGLVPFSIQRIAQSGNRPNTKQIKAIARSGWSASDEYRSLLQAAYKNGVS